LYTKIDAPNDTEGEKKTPEVIDNQCSVPHSLNQFLQVPGPIFDPTQNSHTTTHINSKTVPEFDSSVSSNG